MAKLAPDRSVGDLLHDVVVDAQALLAAETRLIKLEVREAGSRASTAAAWMACAGILALVSLTFLCWAATYGLSVWLPMWASALVVGLLLGGLAGGLFVAAKKKVSSVQLFADRATTRVKESVKEMVEWKPSQR